MTNKTNYNESHQLYVGEALAPMVRASTTPLRTLALKYGADFVYTEELVDRAISGTIRVENETLGTIDYIKDITNMSKKTLKKLEADGGPPVVLRIDKNAEKGRLVCQLGTGEPELALPAAQHVLQDVDAIDINMGCPKKFSVSGGMGSALLSDPERACRIIRSLSSHLDKPVSAKIRLLKDTQSTVDFCTGLIEAGAVAVAIHGRTPGHEAQIPAEWERLEETVSLLKSKFPTTKILINGDFYTRKEFQDFQNRTGADGVLLGRPALYNCSIFRKPNPSTPSDIDLGYRSPLLLDKTSVVQDYLREAVRYDTHYKNVKYVVCEFMSNRRTPSPRVPAMPINFSQTIANVCDARSLDELCQVWNINSSVVSTKVKRQAPAGEHRYEDSYWLDPVANTDSSTTNKRIRVESQ